MKMDWYCDSDEENHKYNSDRATWPPFSIRESTFFFLIQATDIHTTKQTNLCMVNRKSAAEKRQSFICERVSQNKYQLQDENN